MRHSPARAITFLKESLMPDLTHILQAVGQGDHQAPDQLLAIVYDELHRIASRKLAGESPGQTLQTTALVHEAYLRLLPPGEAGKTPGEAGKTPGEAGETPGEADRNTGEIDSSGPDAAPATTADTGKQPSWESRGHFFAAAAEAMRRILIDNARRKNRLKRGGGRARVEMDNVELAIPEPEIDLLALDDALVRLEESSPEKAAIVKLRYFAGLTREETAAALGISVPTVQRHWRYARAWLRRAMEDDS